MNPKSKLSLIARGSTLRILQTLTSIIIGFLMMPFLIKELGEELYGLWIVVGSIVATFHLLDLGFNQAVTRNVAKHIHQKNYTEANKYINTAVLLYSALGLTILSISVLGAYFGADKLVENTENLTLTQMLIIIGGVTIALEFPSKAFPGILSAYMRFDVIAIIRLVSNLVNAALIYTFISNGFGIISLAVITFLTSVINTSVFVWYTTRAFSNIEFGSEYLSKSTLKSAFNFSKWVFVFDLNDMLKGKIDIWLVAFYQGNYILTVYYVSVRLIDYAIQFLRQATNLSGPIFTEYYAKGENEKLKQSIESFLKIYTFCSAVVACTFYLIGESFISLWMGKDFDYRQAYICLLLLSLGRFSNYISEVFFSLSLTLNIHKIVSYISMLETLLVAILCYLLIPQFSLIGAAIAVSAPSVVCRLLLIPIFVIKNINFSLSRIWWRVFSFISLSVMFGYYLSQFSKDLKVFELFFYVVVVIIVHLFFAMILVSKTEINWIFKQVKSSSLFNKLVN